KMRCVGAAGFRAKRFDGRREMLFAAAGKNHRSAETREFARVTETDAGSAAGDDAYTTIERFFWKHCDRSWDEHSPVPRRRDHISRRVFGSGDESAVAGAVVDDDCVTNGVVGRIELH